MCPQIQRISATIADLAKSAQLNINDLNYVSRVRSEIATLSSVLISYSVNPEVRYTLMIEQKGIGVYYNIVFYQPREDRSRQREVINDGDVGTNRPFFCKTKA